MAIDREKLRPIPDWEFKYSYTDIEENEINCGKVACSIGMYVVGFASEFGTGLQGPACTDCGYTAGLGDVFNPDEPRYEPGAPEAFKKAAARILTLREHSPLETAIRIGRPDTAAMIDEYAAIED